MNSQFVDLLSDRRLVQDVLSRLELIQPGESINVEQLAGGVSSTILRIESRRRSFCLKQALPYLKVARQWSAPIERVYAEVAWLKLARTIVSGCSPEILGVDHVTNSFVMTFLPPHGYSNWKAELMARRIAPGFAAEVGGRLVQIHAATAGREEIERDFSNHENFIALRLDPYLLEVARQHPELAGPIHFQVRQIQLRKMVLIHGDISPKNILMGPQGPVFLDAECACYSDPAFDAAFCLNHLLLKSFAIRESSESFLRAFEDFAGAYLSGVDWEPRAELESKIAGLLPVLMLARISGKSPVEYLNPFQQEVIIRAAAPLIIRPPANLADLVCTWNMGVLRDE